MLYTTPNHTRAIGPINAIMKASETPHDEFSDFFGFPQRFSTFQKILQKAHFANLVATMDSFTVFAPSNVAFENGGNLTNILQSSINSRRFVEKYIVEESRDARLFLGNKTWARTLSGQRKLVNGVRGFLFDGIPIGETDIGTENGVAHEILRLEAPKYL